MGGDEIWTCEREHRDIDVVFGDPPMVAFFFKETLSRDNDIRKHNGTTNIW